MFPSIYPFVLWAWAHFEIYFTLHYTESGAVSGDNQSFLTWLPTCRLLSNNCISSTVWICVCFCFCIFLCLFLYLQSSEREQSVFPNTTPCLPPPLWVWPVTIVVFFLLFALDSLPSIILSYLLIFHQWPWGFLPPRKLCLPKEIPWIPLYWILKSVFSCSAPIISSSQMSQLRDWAWHSICQKCY